MENIKIPEINKTSFIGLFLFIYKEVFKKIFFKPALLLIFIAFIYYITIISKLTYLHISTKLSIIFIAIPLSISLEETFHAAILLRLNRNAEVVGLRFKPIKIFNINFTASTVAVHFNGNFSPSDVMRISLSGPIMSLIIGTILSTIVSTVKVLNIIDIPFQYVFLLIYCLLLCPLAALIPLKIGITESDGLRIRMTYRELGYSPSCFLKELRFTIKEAFAFIFI